MVNILLYTAITGNFDKPRTDIKVINTELFKDPRRSARQHKCLTPDFWQYNYSIWVDGNTSLKVDPQVLIDELGDADILVYKHWRDCIYDEAAVLTKAGHNKDIINNQMNKYILEGYPKHNGLACTTYIIRKHNLKVEEFNNMWWSEICRGSERDQLSFNYVAWRTGINIKYFNESHIDIHKKNTNFNYTEHGVKK